MTLPSILGSGLGGRFAADFDLLNGPELSTEVARGVVFDDVIEAAEAGLTVTGGTVVFDAAAAATAGLSAIDCVAVDAIVDALNAALGKNHLKLGDGSTGWEEVESLTEAYYTGDILVGTLGTIDIKVEVTTHWWGVKIHFNKGAVQKIAEMLNAGAGAAAVLSALEAAGVISAPKAVVTALVSALLWLGGANLSFMDWCNGVDFCWPWVSLAIIKKPA